MKTYQILNKFLNINIMFELRSVFLLFLLYNLCNSSKLPSDIQQCNRKSPEFNKCLAKALESALHTFTKPNKELSVPNMEPLDIPEMTIGAGTGAVNLVQNYKNVKLHGYTKMAIKSVDFDFEKKTLNIDHYADEFKMIADYDINGRILLLPVYGKGPCTIIMEKVECKSNFTFEEVEKKGKKYLKFLTCNLILEPALAKYRFENLFDGNKELGENINAVLNDNWKEIFSDVRQGYEKAFAQIHLGIANSVFSKFSEDDVFSG